MLVYRRVFEILGQSLLKESCQSTRSASLSIFLNLFVQDSFSAEGSKGFCVYTLAAKNNTVLVDLYTCESYEG